jgi:peptidoglycan/xylan/chitin deacetylase (PgdA/CDA1 family)
VFRSHIETLAENEIRVVPLERVRAIPGAVAITFDDAFGNFIDHALPVLRVHRFPATVFAVSGYCGGQNNWPSQPAGTPRMQLMGWNDLRDVAAAGFEIGAHTVTHPRLTTISDERVREELQECRRTIEDRTGASVRCFAYPYGDCDLRVRRITAGEFPMACGTSLRFLDVRDDPLELPRIDTYYLRNPWAMRHLLGVRGRAYILARGWLRSARAAVRS